MFGRKNIFGTIVICFNHLAGFLDLTIVPIWIGVLVQHYHNNPQQAGGILSLFLAGQVIASVSISPRFANIQNPRLWTAIGYLVAAVCMFFSAQSEIFMLLALLHFIAGLSAGLGISLTHGMIGRSVNPHRLFAVASVSLSVLCIAFYAFINPIIIKSGGPVLFYAIGGIMMIAFVGSALAFPNYGNTGHMLNYESEREKRGGAHTRIPSVVWFTVAGLMGMAMVTAMISSFGERAGIGAGYAPMTINRILMINGLVMVLPPLLAAVLQNHVKVRTVAIFFTIFQIVVTYGIYTSTTILPYTLAIFCISFCSITAHTFIFGYLARMDSSGRVVAANTAIIMTGSMLGPFLGGTLVTYLGFSGIAYFVTVWNLLVLFICFRGITEAPRVIVDADAVALEAEKPILT